MSRRPEHYLAAFLILRKGEKILLQRRCNTGHMDGMYSLPSGHVELGESFTEALVREVAEEIGIMLTEVDVENVHIQHISSDDREYVDAYFVADTWSGEITNMEPEKCDDLAWFPANQLPENTVHYIRDVLERIKKGERYSEYGWDER